MLSQTEENYLKGIYKIAEKSSGTAGTNAIAAEMQTTAASVTDMLKRLSEKNLLQYEKYKGVQLSEEGTRIAMQLIRRHRLWEVFLLEKLGFGWDEVHTWAEELEHISGDKLTDRLDAFLGFPAYDPHGDPIPDANGKLPKRNQIQLSELEIGKTASVVGVQEHSPAFLQYLLSVGLGLGAELVLLERVVFDQSVRVRIGGSSEAVLSDKVCRNLFVMPHVYETFEVS